MLEDKPSQHQTRVDLKAVRAVLHDSGRIQLQRLRELSVARRLTDSVALDEDVEKTCGAVLDILLDELPVDNASIMLFDPEKRELKLKVARGVDSSNADSHDKGNHFATVSLKKGEGVAGKVLEEATPILINDVEKDERFLTDPRQSVEIGSLLCLPLLVRGETVGVLNLSCKEKNSFQGRDLHGMIIVANQIAVQLDHARMYKELQEINSELEEKVRQRTEYLERTHKKLQQTKSRMAQTEKLRALGQMASGVAHDFNNSLAAIIGYTQLLLADISAPEQREKLKAVEMAARDGAATVKRIQEFSRTRRTREFVPLNLRDLISDVLTITKPVWKDQLQKSGRKVEFVTRLNDVNPVAGDGSELREAFTNIILNALDAMPSGGRITVSTWTTESRGFVRIEDSGTGMSSETVDRIFDPFFTSKGPGNSGLGLSVAYGIIRRHEGEIAVESELGKGTTFTIRLPLSQESAADKEKKGDSQGMQKARILLIDDDNLVRDVLATMIEQLGHEVVSVAGGREGLAELEKQSFDAVLTDLGMPDLSGWEVAAAIKRRTPSIPVVLITGWGNELNENEMKEKGVDLLLCKPFELTKVQSIVVDALQLRQGLRENHKAQ
ncbi:MAG: response regulator [Deltaproteobacteria bacterium]|nr:response regulator [Deltaproteobacteria bacterium]MBW2069690.1 response regulator [Deltaproteobacteria bacterium]